MAQTPYLSLAVGVGAVALAAAQASRGSRSVASMPSASAVGREFHSAVESMLHAIRQGLGPLVHESEEAAVDPSYHFTSLNAAAIREGSGKWYPAFYKSSYDSHTGMEDGDFVAYDDAGLFPRPEDALVVAVAKALIAEADHGRAHLAYAQSPEGSQSRGSQSRGSSRGSRSKKGVIQEGFASFLERALAFLAKSLDKPFTVVQDVDGYSCDALSLGVRFIPDGITRNSIIGPKKADGYEALVYDANGDDHAIGIARTPVDALLLGVETLALDAMQGAVQDQGYARSLKQDAALAQQWKKDTKSKRGKGSRATTRLDTLFADLRSAPYAYHGPKDVEKWVTLLSAVPLTGVAVGTVAEALENDAQTHQDSWNQRQSEIIGALANRVWDLA